MPSGYTYASDTARLDANLRSELTMQEQEFFSSDNVYVGFSRFVASGHTYAMSGVTSVRAAEIKPSLAGATLVGLVGFLSVVVGCYGSGAAFLLGVVLLGLAAMLVLIQKPTYYVCLTTASGEVRAVKSDDRSVIANIVQALNDCIVARG